MDVKLYYNRRVFAKRMETGGAVKLPVSLYMAYFLLRKMHLNRSDCGRCYLLLQGCNKNIDNILAKTCILDKMG